MEKKIQLQSDFRMNNTVGCEHLADEVNGVKVR